MGINIATVAGRLVRPVELRYAQSGNAWATFTLATDTGFGDNKSTLFLDCKCFGKGSEVLEKYTSQGAQLTVSGELTQESWEKDGQKRSKVVLVVRDFQLPPKGVDAPQADAPAPMFNDNDIPF